MFTVFYTYTRDIKEDRINPKIFLRHFIFLYRGREIERQNMRYGKTKRFFKADRTSDRCTALMQAHFDKTAHRYRTLHRDVGADLRVYRRQF